MKQTQRQKLVEVIKSNGVDGKQIPTKTTEGPGGRHTAIVEILGSGITVVLDSIGRIYKVTQEPHGKTWKEPNAAQREEIFEAIILHGKLLQASARKRRAILRGDRVPAIVFREGDTVRILEPIS